jgi:hypothetical protein
MNNVVLEHRIESQQGEPYRMQILDDGTCQSWSGMNYIITANGQSSMQPQEPKWRPYTHLNAERLERLKAAIISSGFFQLNEQYAPEHVVKDGGTVIWYASLNGASHTVTITDVDMVSIPQIANLAQAMKSIMQEALDEGA